MLTIDNDNHWEIPVFAVRYALGRKTFAPHEVISWLMPQVRELTPNAAGIIARDIREWQEDSRNVVGWYTDRDRDQWDPLVARLNERAGEME